VKSTASEKSWKEVEKKIEESQDLIRKSKKLEERLRKVEEERGTVEEKIYNKVKSDYEKELAKIKEKIDPLKEEAELAREQLKAEIKDLDNLIRIGGDSIAEIEFRHRVGEFDEATKERKIAPLKDELERNQSKKNELLGAFEKLDILFDFFRDGNNEPAGDDTGGDTLDAAPTPDTDSFEGILDEDPLGTGARVSSGETLDLDEELETSPLDDIEEDPLADLADPLIDESYSDPETSDRDRSSPPKSGTPTLTIKGPGIDKVVPVLPITMSIGREHDNNIEIKDEEVSRYHARITHENGRYVLRTLEESSNTWVNGERMSEVVLKDKDKIRIGRTELRFNWK
jgi:hypothetical protein